jgi:hypothetical protein
LYLKVEESETSRTVRWVYRSNGKGFQVGRKQIKQNNASPQLIGIVID